MDINYKLTEDSPSVDNFTKILNLWSIDKDTKSANALKSMVYYHLKGIVKEQIKSKSAKNSSTRLVEQLPNTTSFLHDVFLRLAPPEEIFDNRKQYYLSLALFVRWMLLDELKSKNALKRNESKEHLFELIDINVESDPYYSFDLAFVSLEKLSSRCYQVALLHYYLGFAISDIEKQLKLKKSTVYQELATAKAYLRTQYKAA